MENNEYFVSINDVSKRLSVPAHTLRYWEKQFPVAIRPTTGAGGRRYYRTETVSKLTVIRDLLYTHGMTIAGVKKLLRDGNLPDLTDALLTAVRNSEPENIVVPPAPIVVNKIDTDKIDTALTLLKTARSLLGN
ncbi:MAG: MerR family transcriptional regulator [Alphaproteobacteria bacterium]|nr:MerR family transcriptional regulator [Alphaproteobacteria bacterium]